MAKYNKGDHVLLKCSNCDCPLVDLIIIMEMDVNHTVKANCHNCGDSSFEEMVDGAFSPGHTEYSVISETDMSDGKVVWTTVKGEKVWAK